MYFKLLLLARLTPQAQVLTIFEKLVELESRIEQLKNQIQINYDSNFLDKFYINANINNIMSEILARNNASILYPSYDLILPEKMETGNIVCTQKSMESNFCIYWTRELKKKFCYNFKLWERAFVLQNIYANGCFGKRGLGFAVGKEPLPSYLVSKGCQITATDKPKEGVGTEFWNINGFYASGLNDLYYANLTEKKIFYQNCAYEYADMNHIPEHFYNKYDFCWSICALEHLGSIKKGVDFVLNSLKVLKPGAIAVHTTAINIFSNDHTPETDLYSALRKKDFEEMRRRVMESGAIMGEFDFSAGEKFLDKFFNVMPPSPRGTFYPMTETQANIPDNVPYLRPLVFSFPYASIGFVIHKGN